jgi:phage tail-like protein
MYQEDDLTTTFVSIFDDALAPVFATLDNIDAYLDPRFAPEDFVEWLATWVNLPVDETWSEERKRAVVGRAAGLYRRRGTVTGLADHIELLLGTRPEIADGGGVSWSQSPGAALPGSDRPDFTVRLRAPEPSAVDERQLDMIVAASKPAHLVHRIEVLPA